MAPSLSPRSHAPSLVSLVVALVLVSLTASQAASTAQNWGQWRGPMANGVAPDAKPPVTWSETNNVKWKVPIAGRGSATPIVWDNLIFVQTAIAVGQKAAAPPAQKAGALVPQVAGAPAPSGPPPGENEPGRRRRPGGPGGPGGRGGRSEKPTQTNQFALLCLDRATGKTLWQQVLRSEVPHEGHHQDHGFASHSPITDGQHILGWFGSRGLHCLDMQGNVKWSKDLGHLRTKMSFGEGNSPALHGDTVVVNWDHEGEDFIVAFNVKNGNELWRQPRSEDTTWSTPLIVEHDGKAQVVTCATAKIRSYDLATGNKLWECSGLTANVIPSPVNGHGLVYAISGFRGAALLAIKLGRTGDLTGTDAIAWQHNKATPYVPSPLLYGERLYFFSNNNNILSCLNAKSGAPHFDAQRLEGISGVYASPVGAAGKVYLTGRNGAVMVIEDAPQLKVLATNQLDDKFDASPAIAGRELFLRGQQSLYCLAEK